MKGYKGSKVANVMGKKSWETLVAKTIKKTCSTGSYS